MALQTARSGTAKVKRNSWRRGNGSCSMQGELRGGISMNKKILNRKVRHAAKIGCRGSDYKKVCRTILMVDFT